MSRIKSVNFISWEKEDELVKDERVCLLYVRQKAELLESCEGGVGRVVGYLEADVFAFVVYGAEPLVLCIMVSACLLLEVLFIDD